MELLSKVQVVYFLCIKYILSTTAIICVILAVTVDILNNYIY